VKGIPIKTLGLIISTVKPAYAVASIKQSPVFKGHLFGNFI